MAISDPLAIADFWERLVFMGRPEFQPRHYRKQSIDGADNARSAAFGRQKWFVDVTLEGGRHDSNMVQEADIMRLEGMDQTFLAYDIRKPYPADDLDGWKLGDTVQHIKSKGSNNRSLALEDLRPNFKVTKTDKISVLYQSTKYFLTEVMETVTADVNGDTTEFEIWPPMPSGVAVADAVTLIKPPAKFKIIAGSYRPAAAQGNLSSGISFSMFSVP